MILLQILVGALLNRWRGSGKEVSKCILNYFIKSKGTKQVIMGIVKALFIYHSVEIIWLASLCGGLFIPLIAIGWGDVFDMGRNPEGWKDWESRVKDHWYDWFLTPIFGRETAEWGFLKRWIRDFTGMTLRGLFITVPIGALIWIFAGYTNYMWCGALMGISYEIGYHIKDTKWLKKGSEYGETIFGAVLYGFI